MIVLDASVLIAHLDDRDIHHSAAEALLAVAATEDLLAHPVSLAEVLVAPVRLGRQDVVTAALAALEVAEWSPTSGEPLRLAELRVRTGLKLPDCCVLSAALSTRSALATFDDRLAVAARELGVEIVEPL